MSQANELDWKKYEAITKYIYETLGRTSGIKVDGFGPNCKLLGKSGVSHQIDVLTSHTDGSHSYQTAIECKYWNKKINKDTVMKVSAIIEDTGVKKGIIVSKSGFTSDGQEFARYKNIGLVHLKESGEKTPDGQPENIDIWILELKASCTIHRPEILSTVIDYVERDNTYSAEINIYSTSIKLPSGKQIPFSSYAKVFQDELHSQYKLFQSISKSYEIGGGILINRLTNTSSKIKRVTFTGMLKKIDSNHGREFFLVDQVWMIMKEIFEERIFKITENGLIAEDKKYSSQ